MTTAIQMPEVHPAAEVFPHMTAPEFDALKQSIADNGQIDPCVVHEGVLLDGRNRWRACSELGIQPSVVTWNGEGGSPTRYIAAKNLQRRHLDASQRAMIGVQLLPMFEAEAKQRMQEAGVAGGQTAGRGRPLDRGTTPGIVRLSEEPTPKELHTAAQDAAEVVGVGQNYIYSAKRVSTDPELAEEVKQGRMSVKKASGLLQEKQGRKRVPHRRAAAVADDQMFPNKNRPTELVSYGFDGLAQTVHNMHSIAVRVNEQILVATESWTIANRARLISELEVIERCAGDWLVLLKARDAS